MNIQMTDYEKDCIAHMHANGIAFEGILKRDGSLHRFSIDSKKTQPDEWYVCYEGLSAKGSTYLICSYGTWSGGAENFTYKSYETGECISNEERQEIRFKQEQRKQQLDIELREDRKNRIARAQEIWEQAINTPSVKEHSSYLEMKQVNAYGLKYRVESDGIPQIVIPLCNNEGHLQAVQCIQANGTKRIYGVKKGNFHVLGLLKDEGFAYVSEGYATGASVHKAEHIPVVVSFDCGNMKSVIANLKARYPKLKLIIAADDDSETKGNPGKTKAEEAAKLYGCNVITPTFPKDFKLPNGKLPTDFNDLHVHHGLDEVKRQLTSLTPYLVALNITDLLTREFPPRMLILSPWLPEKGLTMIYAARGIGKTFLSLSIAYAIACGESFLGWQVLEPRKVLYVDGEMPAVALQDRLKSISKSFNKKPPNPSYFKIVAQDFQSKGIKDLATLIGQHDVNELLDDVDLVILDNLSTLMRSGIENEAESWLLVQEWALSLRKAGKAIMFIHHAGKNGTARGTSKREDILDSIIMLKRPQNYSSKDGARFEIHFEKSRGFFGEDADPFEASLLTGADEVLTWKRSKVRGCDLESVTNLYNNGVTSQRAISNETGMSLGKVNKLIKEAQEEGLL